MTETVIKHGEEVVEGKIVVSPFAREFNQRFSENSYFNGTWEKVVELVSENWENNEPGTGSEDGDTLLIRIPDTEGFFSPVAEITAENEHMIQEETRPRRKGEKPVTTRFIIGEKVPANVVKVVVYRADVLAKDNDRSSDAEWEIICILAQPQENVPMHPHTMERNNNNDEGGTYREYSDEEWVEAREFWAKHVYIREEEA